MIGKIQNENELNTASGISIDLIYLASCAVCGVVPDKERIKKMDLAGLFRAAQFHLLSSAACMALESAGVFEADSFLMAEESMRQLAKDWKEKKNKAIRKNLLLDTERRELLAAMEREGIWYLPLKGIILKEFYPKAGMRQMADNDILFDSQFQWRLKEIMESRGFQTISIARGNHDVYEKKPVYNYEMHTSLYGRVHDEAWAAYYSNVKERLIKEENSSYGYHFSDEDFYVYLITHACKHHNSGGTGIRSLLDIYVYLRKMESALDWNYISGELQKLHVEDFEADSRRVAEKLFSQEVNELNEREAELLRYFLGSGAYGTMKNRVVKKLHEYQKDGEPIKAGTKRRYLVGRLFPDEEFYQNYAPFAYRHRWFIPIFIPFRAVRGVLRNGKKIVREFKMVVKIKE